MPGESKTSKRRIAAREKHAEALKLRKQGKSYQVIADELGWADPSGAQKAVKVALDRVTLEDAEDVKKMELARLDQMLDSLEWKISVGDYAAIDRALKIMERRARYLGLDAPDKQAFTDPTGEREATLILIPERDQDNGKQRKEAKVKDATATP
jgi:hypothetical protein